MTRAGAFAPGILAAIVLATAVVTNARVSQAPATLRAPQTRSSPEQAAAAFKEDVHVKAGLTCESCHGPSRPDGAWAPVSRTAIAPMCATCHANATYMRKFAPQVRTDQYAQYQTSVHGQQMAKGETAVATCSDCHQSHGIVQVRDARSPVAPSRVARTCATCHADQTLMGRFDRSHEVFSDWTASVHAEALLVRGDTSAPTCSTCHGSHGATPPGVDAVANVCAQCHVPEADLFKASPKAELFGMLSPGDCLTCHSNHKIERPDETWISLESPALCATCHDETVPGAEVIKAFRGGFDDLSARRTAAHAVLERAETAGMLIEDGMLALHDATEAHVRMRVAVHAFATPDFEVIHKEGVTAADRAHTIGDEAMGELQYRRSGLAIATLVILGFLVTLFIKIRRLPPV